MSKEIVLASASPRRVELLRNLGLSFRILPSEVDENFEAGQPPEQVVIDLARRKAAAVKDILKAEGKGSQAYIIAADTIVVLDQEILGKPTDEADARQMLSRLSGRAHQVYTGVCLLWPEGEEAQAEVSDVVFRPLAEAEINCYVATGEPMDKAGAYAVQGIGAFLVERIEGAVTNIVGLPVVKTMHMLRAAGLHVMDGTATL